MTCGCFFCNVSFFLLTEYRKCWITHLRAKYWQFSIRTLPHIVFDDTLVVLGQGGYKEAWPALFICCIVLLPDIWALIYFCFPLLLWSQVAQSAGTPESVCCLSLFLKHFIEIYTHVFLQMFLQETGLWFNTGLFGSEICGEEDGSMAHAPLIDAPPGTDWLVFSQDLWKIFFFFLILKRIFDNHFQRTFGCVVFIATCVSKSYCEQANKLQGISKCPDKFPWGLVVFDWIFRIYFSFVPLWSGWWIRVWSTPTPFFYKCSCDFHLSLSFAQKEHLFISTHLFFRIAISLNQPFSGKRTFITKMLHPIWMSMFVFQPVKIQVCLAYKYTK